jgi:hypothetical protein
MLCADVRNGGKLFLRQVHFVSAANYVYLWARGVLRSDCPLESRNLDLLWARRVFDLIAHLKVSNGRSDRKTPLTYKYAVKHREILS